MQRNKRGEEMVEAAMVLPILLLLILSLLMVMLYHYDCHQAQMKMHQSLIAEVNESDTILDIKKNKTETSSAIAGLVQMVVQDEVESRVYLLQEATWIGIGEMLTFDEK